MGKAQRVTKVLSGLLRIIGALVIVLMPENGLLLILLILSLMFAASGVKDIVRYFTMTRYMVGGKLILFRGVIVLDFGLFSASLSAASPVYISLYLIGLFAFDGVIDIMRAMESKKLRGGWRFRFGEGLVKILLGVACLVFMRNESVLAALYAVSLTYSALMSIASAFRRTSVIHIA